MLSGFRGYPAYVVLAGFAFMVSCSRDATLVNDYRLYDLDGSNQAIGGSSGMVNVSDITALRVEGVRIYFETGEIGLREYFAKPGAAKCGYGYIDAAKDTVVFAELGSTLETQIANQLKESAEMVVYRSCAVRGYDTSAISR